MGKKLTILIIIILAIITLSMISMFDYFLHKQVNYCLENENPNQEQIQNHLNYLGDKRNYEPLYKKVLQNPFKKRISAAENRRIENEIAKLFSEPPKIYVYQLNNLAEIKKGNECYTIIFGIQNQFPNSNRKEFNYKVKMDSSNCNISNNSAMSLIESGEQGSMILAVAEEKYATINFNIPENTPDCIIRYTIEVKTNEEFYISESFDITIE